MEMEKKELLLVSDDFGNPFGFPHERGAEPPPGAFLNLSGVMLLRTNGDIVLSRNSVAKGPDKARKWQPTAVGHVDFGETPLEAAQRELKEEVGISAPIAGYVSTSRKQDKQGRGFGPYYHVYSAVSDDPLYPDPAEIEECRAFAPEELRGLVAESPGLFVPPTVWILSLFDL
jgi:isopentenyl-diphosphate delta-isomerase